ncbi:oligosaccharide flippase family protein [Liquorilactobacillus oeni]|uniref:Polysaccharide transporter n=1 Tax=Liquorilactobacillus oeni DSM 19972 TaxID=1423777 RepID=A0A0R1MDS6_9LACO|nr:oligosaccharide flippase family protein [Liquorilactobacillus oeni]KRL06239.1 polysaccharide transporter [Liquorilactobacillus oeni DSM 19972]
MKSKPTESLFKGAAVLTVASLTAKILSALYRIPFENLVGNTGFYIYQQIYPLYGIAVMFSLNGFPIYISKLVAACPDEASRNNNARHLFAILSLFGGALFGVLQIGAPAVGYLMGDKGLTQLVRSVSWIYLLVPFLAVGRGYKQGILQVLPTALSQLIEQSVRVFLIITIAFFATHAGWSLYRIGSWTLTAGVIGAFFAFLFFSNFFRQLFFREKFNFDKGLLKKLTCALFSEGLVICFYSGLLVILQLVDSFTMKNALEAAGNSAVLSKNLKGVYDRAQPLLQLGLVLSLSFSASLMPLLSKKYLQKAFTEYQRTIGFAVRVCLAISAAASAGLFILMPVVNETLFGSKQGSFALSVAALSITEASLIVLVNSILQSQGQYKKTVHPLIIITILKLLTSYPLVYLWGIAGASFSSLLSLSTGLIFSVAMLSGLGTKHFLKFSFLYRLAICICIMSLLLICSQIIFSLYLETNRTASLIQCCVTIPAGGGLFVFLIRKAKLFSTEEWLGLPGGRWVVKLIK